MLKAGLTAQRFAGKPLKQPEYSLRDVPRCSRDLSGSALQEVTDRQHFTDAMAEMVLLCNEVMRRQAQTELKQQEEQKHRGKQKNGKHSAAKQPAKRAAKPLSLEYIADRIDVDDPIFGYFVRTEVPPSGPRASMVDTNRTNPSTQTVPTHSSGNSKWQKDMLQGFITVTTFTNWQRTFRWDSIHDSVFAYDDSELAEKMVSGERKYDKDGRLSEELEATVRCGDPWNEGIVWPRIAEISLLGGLGCGRALLSLVIEKLESMPPTGKRNYDYVVLQATDNSIPFYEAMGFTRVGCMTEDEKSEDETGNTENAEEEETSSDVPVAVPVAEPVEITANAESSEVPSEPAQPPEVVSSAVDIYITQKAKEKPSDIAKALKVDVWDIIFLNQFLFPDISPKSLLYRETNLFVPAERSKYDAVSDAIRNLKAGSKSTAIQWYASEDNETPKMIAKKFNVKTRDLVKGNRERLPDLQNHSRLMEGTKLKVSHFDVDEDKHVPYCHWTFPDDTLDSSEPSYMMAYKLNRRRGPAAKKKPVESSFAVPIKKYKPKPTSSPENLVAATPQKHSTPSSAPKSKKRKRHPEEPVPPKKPMTGYFYYMSEQREALKKEMSGMLMKEISKLMGSKWKQLPDGEKAKYEEMGAKAKEEYRVAMEQYKSELDAFRRAHPEWVAEEPKSEPKKETAPKNPKNLFNKVVVLTSDGLKQAGTEFKYYYVLTFLPDLQWCHLAPLRRVGTYGTDKPKAEGRPKWMLVGEDEGKEIDISASFCEVVRSRAMRNVPDADEEEWDIVESGPPTIVRDSSKTKKATTTEISRKKNVNGANQCGVAPLAAPFTNRANDGLARKLSSNNTKGTKIDSSIKKAKTAAMPQGSCISLASAFNSSVNTPAKSSTAERKQDSKSKDESTGIAKPLQVASGRGTSSATKGEWDADKIVPPAPQHDEKSMEPSLLLSGR